MWGVSRVVLGDGRLRVDTTPHRFLDYPQTHRVFIGQAAAWHILLLFSDSLLSLLWCF